MKIRSSLERHLQLVPDTVLFVSTLYRIADDKSKSFEKYSASSSIQVIEVAHYIIYWRTSPFLVSAKDNISFQRSIMLREAIQNSQGQLHSNLLFLSFLPLLSRF
jgi:hypothetical protein